MIIRPIKKNDAREIIKFKKRSIPMCAKGFYSEEIIKHWARGGSVARLIDSIKNGRVRFVAEENGKIIGECSLNKDGKTIQTLYVDIDHQGKKVGSKLLSHCENVLRENKIKISKISAALNSEKFYESNGYKTKEIKEIDFFGLKMKNAFMEKKLF